MYCSSVVCAFAATGTIASCCNAESFSRLYGYCMAAAAPGFALAVLGLGPGAVHWWGYLLLWAFCSGLIGALVQWKLNVTGLNYASRSACCLQVLMQKLQTDHSMAQCLGRTLICGMLVTAIGS